MPRVHATSIQWVQQLCYHIGIAAAWYHQVRACRLNHALSTTKSLSGNRTTPRAMGILREWHGTRAQWSPMSSAQCRSAKGDGENSGCLRYYCARCLPRAAGINVTSIVCYHHAAGYSVIKTGTTRCYRPSRLRASVQPAHPPSWRRKPTTVYRRPAVTCRPPIVTLKRAYRRNTTGLSSRQCLPNVNHIVNR